jgi:hypothetical protein
MMPQRIWQRPERGVSAAVIFAEALHNIIFELHPGNAILDNNWLNHKNVPTLSFGMGGSGAHSINKKLSIPHLHKGSELLLLAMTGG